MTVQRLASVLAWVLALTFFSSASALAQRQLALVYGVGAYEQLGDLPGAPADAQKVASALSSLGFVGVDGSPLRANVNASAQDIARAIAELGRSHETGDTIVFYFAGHGVRTKSDGEDYIIGATQSDALSQNALSVSTLTASLRAGRGTVVIIIDACRNLVPHEFAGELRGAGATRVGLLPVAAQEALSETGAPFLLFQSTAPERYAADLTPGLTPEIGAPFATFLAAALLKRGKTLDETIGDVTRSFMGDRRGADYGLPTSVQSRSMRAQSFCLGGCLAGAQLSVADCPACPTLQLAPLHRGGVIGSTPNDPGRDADEPAVRNVGAGAFNAVLMSQREVSLQEWILCERFGPCRKISRHFSNWPRTAPVARITLADAQTYVRWLAGVTTLPYRLPSEDEWELASRAGAAGLFAWGEQISPGEAAFDYSTTCNQSFGSALKDGFLRSAPRPERPFPTGSFPQNAYNLYDMAGNVWEWTTCAPGRQCHSSGAILRSGSVWSSACELRSANRFTMAPDRERPDVGLRVVRTLVAEDAPTLLRSASQ